MGSHGTADGLNRPFCFGVVMALQFAQAFYNSKRWRRTRDLYMRSCGGLCERCLRSGVYSPAAVVHHKIYLTPDNINEPRITLNPDNLEALCSKCHGNEHERWKKHADGSRFDRKNRRYKINNDGSVEVRGD